MMENVGIIIYAVLSLLKLGAGIAGIIAFLFQLHKIQSFILSFFYLRAAKLKALMLRFNLNIEEMRIVEEFILNKAMNLAFSQLILPPQLGKRIIRLRDVPGISFLRDLYTLEEANKQMNNHMYKPSLISLYHQEELISKNQPIITENENRIQEFNKLLDIQFRLPTSYERTALISLMNKGLLMKNTQRGKISLANFSSAESAQYGNDFEIADSVITDLFVKLFR